MSEQHRRNFDTYLELKKSDPGTAIHELWDSRSPEVWSSEPHFYTRLAETADRVGQTMFAHDVLREALEAFPEDLRLVQLYSLSLVKCGFLLKARDRLVRLVDQGNRDEETLGILGRVYKEMWLAASGGAPTHPDLRAARNLYLKAFRFSRGYYSGINAASLSLVLGDPDTARRISKLVVRICMGEQRRSGAGDYWVAATLGEAHLLLGRQQEAARFYDRARGLARTNYAQLASTRRQLTLLARYMAVDEAVLAGMRIPPVVAFTGHLLDAPGRPSPRFPPDAAPAVKRAIEGLLQSLGAGIGYSSAACGADVLFLEALQARGGESNVVLPFDREDFSAASVAFAGEEWIRRAAQVLEKSIHVEQATRGSYGADDLLFHYANSLIMGKAILRSRSLETEPHLIAVWDGRDNRAVGGTAEFIRIWRSFALPLTVIDSRTGETAQPGSRAGARVRVSRRAGLLGAPRGCPPGREVRRGIVAMLFADMVGYSRLAEEQFPRYIEGFLGTVALRLKGSASRPIFRNIWGDAMMFVFRDLLDAARYAVELRDLVRTTAWQEKGLPQELAVRIGLHVGPVYYAREPVLGRLNFFGTHVNQAARIEPITRAGNVYASEQFAALLLTQPDSGLDCRYVGEIVLPKEFGSYPIYHIRRTSEIE
jgi:class 3 adenylate cyclase